MKKKKYVINKMKGDYPIFSRSIFGSESDALEEAKKWFFEIQLNDDEYLTVEKNIDATDDPLYIIWKYKTGSYRVIFHETDIRSFLEKVEG